MKPPTAHQAKRLAAALNRQRIARGNHNSPGYWATLDNGELVFGVGDTHIARVTDFDAAQKLIRENAGRNR